MKTYGNLLGKLGHLHFSTVGFSSHFGKTKILLRRNAIEVVRDVVQKLFPFSTTHFLLGAATPSSCEGVALKGNTRDKEEL